MALMAIGRVAQELGLQPLDRNHARFFLQPMGYVAFAVEIDMVEGKGRRYVFRPQPLSVESFVADAENFTRLKRLVSSDAVEIHLQRANQLLQLGKPKDAIWYYRQALKVGPTNSQVYYNLGRALEKVGQASEALEHYLCALDCRPDFFSARRALERVTAYSARAPQSGMAH